MARIVPGVIEKLPQYYLGYCYQNGFGVNKAPFHAVKYFNQAALQGHIKAKMMLDNFRHTKIWQINVAKNPHGHFAKHTVPSNLSPLKESGYSNILG